MTGECNGEAVFVTTVDTQHMQSIFEQLVEKVTVQFPDANIRMHIDGSVADSDDMLPHLRQSKRNKQAVVVAEEQLQQSPVMQYLQQRGEGRLGKAKLIDIL